MGRAIAVIVAALIGVGCGGPDVKMYETRSQCVDTGNGIACQFQLGADVCVNWEAKAQHAGGLHCSKGVFPEDVVRDD